VSAGFLSSFTTARRLFIDRPTDAPILLSSWPLHYARYCIQYPHAQASNESRAQAGSIRVRRQATNRSRFLLGRGEWRHKAIYVRHTFKYTNVNRLQILFSFLSVTRRVRLTTDPQSGVTISTGFSRDFRPVGSGPALISTRLAVRW
jgi:hypothetical protein